MGIEFSESVSRLFFYVIFVMSAFNAGLGANQLKGNKYIGRFFIFVSFLILFIPLGMRTVGLDHDVYKEWFNHADFWLKDNYYLSPEPLFAGLTLLAKDVIGNFQIIYLFSSFVYLVGIFAFLNKYESYGYLSVFFMSFSLYLYMCGLTRISIAIGIVSYAFTELDKKVKPLLLILIASLFHYTALITVIVYLSYRSKRNVSFKNVLYILASFMILSYVITTFSSSLPYVLHRYTQYVKFSFNIRYISSVIVLFPVIVLWTLYKGRYKSIYKEKYVFFDNVIKITFALMILSMVHDGMFRITFFFYPFAAKIYYDFGKILWNTRQETVVPIYISLFTIIGLIYVYAIFFTSPFITPYIIPFAM